MSKDIERKVQRITLDERKAPIAKITIPAPAPKSPQQQQTKPASGKK